MLWAPAHEAPELWGRVGEWQVFSVFQSPQLREMMYSPFLACHELVRNKTLGKATDGVGAGGEKHCATPVFLKGWRGRGCGISLLQSHPRGAQRVADGGMISRGGHDLEH